MVSPPQEIVWSGKNGCFYDALRPAVEPSGLGSAEEVLAHRAYHLERVRYLFENMDIFVFTLGLTETWMHKESGTVFPTAPGTIAGHYDPDKYIFKNFTFEDILQDFNKFKQLIHSKQKKRCKFILTVSPVPLTATASGKHVLLANTYSKSVLRAVAGQLSLNQSDIDYFPSYEIISSTCSRAQFYEANLRSVRPCGVDAVMKCFFASHPPISTMSFNENENTMPKEDDVVCEEAILDAFRVR